MPQNQVLGAGKLFFGKFPTSTFTNKVAERYLGNTPSLSVAKSEQTLDHYNADSGLRKKDISIRITQDSTVSFECDDISMENLALWFEGAVTEVSQPAATGQEDTLVGYLGQYLPLGVSDTLPAGVKQVSNVTVNKLGAGTPATGTLTMGGQPANNDTVTIGGTLVTFKSAAPVGNQVLIGADAASTANNLRAFIAANSSLLGVSTAATGGTPITVTATVPGTAGNSLTLAKSGTYPTVSGATLTGGAAGSPSVVDPEGNYEVDDARGRVFILADAEDIANGDTLTVTYDQASVATEMVLSSDNAVYGRLFFQADNGYNGSEGNKDYTFRYVKLSPNGDYNIKTDNAWVSMSFQAEILAPPIGVATVIG